MDEKGEAGSRGGLKNITDYEWSPSLITGRFVLDITFHNLIECLRTSGQITQEQAQFIRAQFEGSWALFDIEVPDDVQTAIFLIYRDLPLSDPDRRELLGSLWSTTIHRKVNALDYKLQDANKKIAELEQDLEHQKQSLGRLEQVVLQNKEQTQILREDNATELALDATTWFLIGFMGYDAYYGILNKPSGHLTSGAAFVILFLLSYRYARKASKWAAITYGIVLGLIMAINWYVSSLTATSGLY